MFHLFLAIILTSSLQAALPDPVKLLQDYIRIDTTNPPGREKKAAEFFAKIFKDHQIPVEIIDLGHDRANVMATLSGDGTLPPIILLHHMDVVPVEKEFWKHDPFAAVIDNGEIYGRGSVDIKTKGIVDLMTILSLKENKTRLKRDVIFLGVADEEDISRGSKYMIENYKDKIKKAQYLLDEGAGVTTDDTGKIRHFFVSLGEKSPLWLTITFAGKPGHASVPHSDNAVVKVAKASEKILKFAETLPLEVVAGTEDYLELLAPKDYNKLPGFKKDFKTSLQSQTFLRSLSRNPDILALLKTTITLTGLQGSDKVNTIPNQAWLKVDCRLLPGVVKDDFIKKLQELLGKEAQIQIDEYYPAKYTSAKSEFLKDLRRVAGDIPVVPVLLTSSTDSSLYRALGIEVFGFESYPISSKLVATSHGNNERMPTKAILPGIEILTKLLRELDH